MDLFRMVVIEPHSGLFDYASERYGGPLPLPLWPSVILGTVCVYLAFVTVLGPLWMRRRGKPFELRPIMLAYNAGQMVLNIWMGLAMTIALAQQGDVFVLGCAKPTPWLKFMHTCWLANKFMDLGETIIFVLRRKQSQVTFLHLYHHCVVIYYTYMSYVEGHGGYQVITGVLNSFVHALMYAYYFCAIYDRELMGRIMDYKLRLTQVQMIQFLCLAFHFAKPLVGWCPFPGYLAWSGVIQNGVLFLLFSHFYWRTYIVKASANKTSEPKSK